MGCVHFLLIGEQIQSVLILECGCNDVREYRRNVAGVVSGYDVATSLKMVLQHCPTKKNNLT